MVYRGVVLLLRLARVLPFGLLWALARPCAALAWLLLVRQRRLTLAHLALAYGGEMDEAERRALGRAVFLHLARAAAETIHADRLLSGGAEIEVRGREILERLRESGGPVIMFTGHWGIWEMAPALLARMGFEPHVVARHMLDPHLDRLVESMRERAGSRVLYVRGAGTFGMVRHLRKSGWLGLLLDQNTKAAGIEVPFFGRPAHTPTGAVEMALLTGSRVGSVFLWREGARRFVMEIEPPLEFPEGTMRQRIDWGTAEVTRRIEARVRSHPEQWVWMHRRWNDRSGRRRSQRWKDEA